MFLFSCGQFSLPYLRIQWLISLKWLISLEHNEWSLSERLQVQFLLVWVPNLVSQHTFSVQWCHSSVVVSVCLVTSQEKLDQVWSAATTRFVSNYCMKTQVWLDESGVGVLADVPSLKMWELVEVAFYFFFACLFWMHVARAWKLCCYHVYNPGWKRCK